MEDNLKLKDDENKIDYGNVEKFLKIISEDKDRLYLISTKGIGDFIIVGGFSEAVQKRKNKKSTVLVIEFPKRNTGIFFPNVSGIISCNQNIMAVFEKYFHETKNYEGDNYIYANINKNVISADWDWDNNLDMLDRLKVNALRLPPDAPFVYPYVDEISEEEVAALYKKYNLDKDRTIILLPHATTFKNALTKEFWENLSKRLVEKKYIVYTNVADEEEPIEGTEPFSATFPELYHVTDKVKCFIGINSGIFNFLALTNAKLFNINGFPNWFWDISLMFPECNNHTFYTQNPLTYDIEKFLKHYDVSAKMTYTHKIIPKEDIFYSEEKLLEAILREI